MDENLDLSKALEKVQQMLSGENGDGQLGNLIEMLSGTKDSDTSQAPTDAAPNLSSLFSAANAGDADSEMPFDINTVMKLQKLISEMNRQKSDAGSAFLKSLKPFLKKERRDKVDQAVKILGITKAFKVFKEIDKGGV